MSTTITEVSKTSAGPLFLRMKAGIPYAETLAELTHAETMLGQLIGFEHHALMQRYFASYMELRFWALTKAVWSLRCSHILEVAAGFSPRGLIMSERRQLNYLETDLPPMIEAKQEIVARISYPRPNLRFAAVDVLNLGSLREAKTLLGGTSIALIHEGLFTYFPHDQKREIIKNFHELLSKDSGVWVTPDVITREQMNRTTSLSKEYLTKWPTFYPFEDSAEATAMIGEAGFTIEPFSPMKLVPRLRSEVSNERVREILAHEELWVMRPK